MKKACVVRLVKFLVRVRLGLLPAVAVGKVKTARLYVKARRLRLLVLVAPLLVQNAKQHQLKAKLVLRLGAARLLRHVVVALRRVVPIALLDLAAAVKRLRPFVLPLLAARRLLGP